MSARRPNFGMRRPSCRFRDCSRSSIAACSSGRQACRFPWRELACNCREKPQPSKGRVTRSNRTARQIGKCRRADIHDAERSKGWCAAQSLDWPAKGSARSPGRAGVRHYTRSCRGVRSGLPSLPWAGVGREKRSHGREVGLTPGHANEFKFYLKCWMEHARQLFSEALSARRPKRFLRLVLESKSNTENRSVT
jgi:hypothetical protein